MLGAQRVLKRPVLEVTLVCLIILLLAQTLIGALSLSALNRLIADTTADRVEVTAQRAAGNIENGLRLGKPLAQYFGLADTLSESVSNSRDLLGAAVVLKDGEVMALRGALEADVTRLARYVDAGETSLLQSGEVVRRASGAILMTEPGSIALAVPLKDAQRTVVGAIVVSVANDAVAARGIILKNLRFLLIVTILVGVGLAVIFRYLMPLSTLYSGGRARFVVPLLALMLAQGVYAAHTISTFRSAWLNVMHDNVGLLAQGLQQDLNRVLGLGVKISHMRGVEAPFARLAKTFPAISEIDLLDRSGQVLNRANASGALPVEGMPVVSPDNDAFTLVLPLGADTAAEPPQGHLVLHLSPSVIAAGVRGRAVDAITVTLVALVTAGEMLLLLSLLMGRAFAEHGGAPRSQVPAASEDGSEVGRIARPVMFGFLFSWALPLGFLPLYARSLPAGGLDLPPNILLALPISVEMACGLLTALVAGRLADRKGWQMPVTLGLLVTFAGMLASGVVSNLVWFSLARGLVGLGYGLTWMGLQGFIVIRSLPNFRGRNMTTVIAGLYAGHLSGAAVGAMLMEQLGFRSVFLVGAVMLLVPLAGVLVFMRPYMDDLRARTTTSIQKIDLKWSDVLLLLRSRDFVLVLFACMVPFSIAQVGLLSFALPLYLEAEGAMASSVGRILMLYGLCVIYLGPVAGALADRTSNKKAWIVLGGVIGSIGMLGLYFSSGVYAAATAVFLLAVASCCIGASVLPYMLALSPVQQCGAASATGVMRAADKLGQMAGPLLVGAMFGATNMGAGLALTGAIYLGATLVFLLFASQKTTVSR